jgi:hypothetical protein
MDPSEYMGHNEIKQRPSTWYAPRNDDSGEDSEYA